ncbi:hypothetical protein GCM10011368_07040 [Hyunsoonleella pacifica]|nr:hypothetical protein GCM10011368_07040 [Hyunsoonleella pacifica]
MSHYQNLLNDKLYAQEDLISKNDSAFNSVLHAVTTLQHDEGVIIDVFDDNLPSHIQKKHWGFYNIIVCKTGFRNDTVSKIALVGEKDYSQNKLALYVTDYDKPLKLSGNTKILGQIKVPNAKTETAYINGQKGNNIKLKGKQLKSLDKLPKIEKNIIVDVSQLQPISLQHFDKNAIVVNGFDAPTKVIGSAENIAFNNITCKGNVILSAKHKITISNTAHLEDVIISAPFVHITNGFRGNIQIIARDSVKIDENVQLQYPSSIYIKNDAKATVRLGKNSTIAGGIVIDGNTFRGSTDHYLHIEENATVIGTIYCFGSTELKGSVIGSVYTDKFYLKTETSTYENVVLNGVINRDSLPENFIDIPLFNSNTDKRRYAVIKKF